MKIISKIRIHPLFYICAFITIITGFFKDFSYIMLIILVHELGHILTSIYFKWNIEKIMILPFGGITIFNEKINRPLKEELLIALLGPLIQFIFFYNINNPLIIKYNYFLFFFNLLPIVPLDGSKIFNLFLNYFLPFKLSHILTIIVSFLLFSLMFIKFNLIILLIFIFLFFKIINEYFNHNNIFNKFLIERYLNKIDFKKRKTIKKIDSMFRDSKHLFYIDNKYQTEDEILQKRFDIKR
jgi:stage IV sporulation protein FB